MAMAGGMWALLTVCYIYQNTQKKTVASLTTLLGLFKWEIGFFQILARTYKKILKHFDAKKK